ncbi:MAG: hypothetical protein LC745_11080, partial [Planctomycetia bacterium]|nr:hypothetical protein [Planctomycetia bacterium]
SKQVRDAETAWEAADDERVEAALALLKADPATAVRRLEQTAGGCRELIARWERLARALEARGAWTGPERDEAVRLQGYRPDGKALKEFPEAWLTHLFALVWHEAPDREAVARLFQPQRLPDLYRDHYRPDSLPEREDCRASIRGLVADYLAPLRRLEEQRRTSQEGPDRADAAARALILQDGPSARLFLRYHAEARTAFHRAYGSLVQALDRDAEAAEAPAVVAPDEPAAPDVPVIPAESLPPNEADPDPEPAHTTVPDRPPVAGTVEPEPGYPPLARPETGPRASTRHLDNETKRRIV